MLLLSGFMIILGLLQDCAGINLYNCSSEVYYTFTRFDCSIVRSPIPKCSLDDYMAPVYILVDIIPLLIYFPLLILFNVNLASGPAQSFIFFYQALPTAVPIDSA